MSDTTANPQGCEHLDGPYRRLLVEVERYRAAETRLRARCVDLERARVGGGVIASDVSTHEVREAFGWPALPEPLDPKAHAADLDRIRAVRESLGADRGATSPSP